MGSHFCVSTRWSIAFLLLFTLTPRGAAQTAAPVPAPAPSQAAPATVDEIKEALVFESSHTKITYQEDGSDVREVTAVIKVLSQAGVQGLAVLPFSYTSANEAVEFDYVRVRKPDGTVVVTPDYNIQDMPAEVSRSAPMYSDVHEKHVTVKALGVGDTLEYLVRYRTTKPQVPGQFWFAYSFRKDVISKDDQLVIDVPRDKPIKVSSPDVKPQTVDQGSRRIYTWKTANLDRKDDSKTHSPLQQPSAPTPSVQITTFQDWAEVGHWYGELARSQVVATPQIQAKAAELTKGLSSDDDKIRALYDFVSTHYHYVSLSFGIGRYQPHPAEDVFENEYGDCKDKHTLLAALLKAAGYDAWPALINASYLKIDADLPSPGQFDHVITVVPRRSNLLWLDTTPGVAPFALLMPNLRDRQALVMPTDKPAQLMTTPANPPFPSVQTYASKAKLSSDGTLNAHIQASVLGDTGVMERYIFQQYSPAQWKDVVQQMSYRSGFAGDVSAVDVDDVSEINKPLNVSWDYKRPNYSDWENGRISAPLPAMGLEWVEETKKPDGPIFLGQLGTVVYKAEVELPSGKQQAALPSNLKLSEDFADYTSTYALKNDLLTVTRELTLKKSSVPLSEWEKYKGFAKAMGADRDSWIQFGEEHGEITPPTPSNPEAERYFKEGYEALQRRDITRAEESFQRVLDSDPNYPGAHANLGVAYLTGGNVDAGIRELKREEELHPDLAFPYETLARVYAFKHDNAAAIDQLHNLLKVDPKNRDAALNLGKLLSSEKRYGEALLVLEKAADEAPDSRAVKYELGYAYIHNGDKEKGLATLQEALKNDQEHDRDTLALNNVAYSLIEMDTGMDVAKQYAEKALQQEDAASLKPAAERAAFGVTTGLDAIWDTVGWVYFKQGQYDKALPYVRAAWLLGQHAEVGDHLGQIYAKLGKKQEAEHTYRLAYGANSMGARTPSRIALDGKIEDHYGELTGTPLSEGIAGHSKGQLGALAESAGGELSRMREVKITNTSHAKASGTFDIVFSPGKIDEVKQVDGDPSLKALVEQIKTPKFAQEFPDSTPAKVVRRGIVSCGSLGCDMVLVPVNDQSLFAGE